MSTQLSQVMSQTLKDTRRGLLRLHKILLDQERAAYERAHDSVSSGELLQLVISDPQFAWLHALSELIVRIDELLDAKEPATTEDARALLKEAQTLLAPAETGSDFQRKYYAALQADPDAVLTHREVMLLFPVAMD